MIQTRDIDVTLIGHEGNDRRICQAARVSTIGADSGDTAEHAGLINYLMRNRHGTPFEHGSMTFLVQVPIFVSREWMRHRTGWSYNETSTRYRAMQPEFYLPAPERNLVQTGKVGDYVFEPGTPQQVQQVREQTLAAYEAAWSAYTRMKDAGVANEVARNVLPLGLLMTAFYATCNPRSAMHFLALRTQRDHATNHSTPLAEIDDAATMLEYHFANRFPLTYAAFEANGRVAP